MIVGWAKRATRTPGRPAVYRLAVPPLRHRFQRFQRSNQISQAHRQTGINEHVDQIVIGLDSIVRDATGKDDHLVETQRVDSLAQSIFLRTTAYQQQSNLRHLLQHARHCFQQQGESFIGIERTDKSEHGLTLQTEIRLKLRRPMNWGI